MLLNLSIQYYTKDFVNKFTEEIIGTSIDQINGKLYLSNNNQDCCLDFQTRSLKCQKENLNYNPAQVVLIDRLYAAFLNPPQNQVIFCQLGSIRIFSITDQKYTKALYDNNFNPEFLFYNQKYGYIIFQVKVTYVFKEISLTNFTVKSIQLPILNQSTTSYTRIIISFLDDDTYIYVSSDLLYISIYNQVTHALIAQITLINKVDYLTDFLVDQTDGYAFFCTSSKTVEYIQYKNRIYIGSLATTTTPYQPTFLSYDQNKKRLLIIRYYTLQIVDVRYQRVNFQTETKEFISNFSLSYKKNKIFIASVLSNSLIDYSQILQNNNHHNYKPRFYKLDSQTIIHINDNLSVISLFQGTNLINQMSLKQLRLSSFSILFNQNYSQLIIFVVDQIFVVNYTKNKLKIQNIINLESKFLKILKDTKDYAIFLLQSQKLVQINKTTSDNLITKQQQLTVGLCLFTVNEKYIAFLDCISNDKLYILEISTFSITAIQLTNQIISLRSLGENYPQIIILTPTSIILFDLLSKSQVKEILLNLPQDCIIEIDLLYNRIYLVNQLYDTFVFNFNLENIGTKNLESFGLNIQLDDKFIYYITSHSANIYYRKDLTFFTNFRQFNSALNLQKISYLNVGYFFLVEFVEQISIYEFSPFLQAPKIKFEIPFSNYALIDFQLTKLNQNSQDNLYLFKIYGVSFQNTFSYFQQLDLYSEQIQICSQTYELLSDKTFDQNSVLNLNQQLITLKQTLSNLVVKIESEQIIRPPNVIRTFLSNSNFDLQFTSTKQNQSVIVNSLFVFDSQINSLKLSNIFLKVDSQNPSIILINPQTFKGLKKLHLENIIFQDLEIIISDLQEVVIQNIKIYQTSQQKKSLLSIVNVPSISILEIDITIQTSIILDTLIKISQSTITSLGSIIINQVQLNPTNQFQKRQIQEDQSFKKLLSLKNINNLNIEVLSVKTLILSNTHLLDIQNISQLSFGQIDIQNCYVNIFSESEYSLNKFANVTSLKINEQIIKNIMFLCQNQIIVNKFSFLQNLTLLKGRYTQIFSQNEGHNNILIHLESINETQLKDIIFSDSENIGLLNAISLQVTPQIVSSNININLQEIKIFNLQSINILINIKSLQTNLSNIYISSINISNKFQFNTIIIQSDEITVIKDLLVKQIKNNIGSFMNIISTKNIVLEKLIFSSVVTLKSASCMKISNSLKLTIKECSFDNNYSVSDAGSIYLKQVNEIQLLKNTFKKNISEQGSGGAIYCDESSFQQINDNYFSENESKNGSGGAIYLINCEVKQLNNNSFNSNSAFIGGAIRYQQFKPIIFISQNNIENIKKSNRFYKNSCISYGQDIGSYPIVLDVKNSYEDDFNSGIAQLENVSSGYKTDEPLKIRFIDEEFKEVTFFNYQKYINIDKNIVNEFNQYFLTIESQKIGLLGDLNQGYNFEQYSFAFDLSYSYQPEKSEKITIKSTSELPSFVEGEQKYIHKVQKIDIVVSFRECLIGEIIQQQGKYTTCYKCSQGFYSLTDPYSSDNLSCKRCPVGSVNCSDTSIQLMNGYWRENNMTDIIVSCYQFPQNCQPESIESKNNCIEGHVGPMCLECDIQGNIWGKQYGKASSEDCVACEKFYTIPNVSIFILIFAFIFWQVLGKLKKQQSDIQKHIMITTLEQLGFKSFNFSQRQTETSSIFKILINYFQSVMIINSLDINIFQFSAIFDFYSVSGGDPSKNTINKIDCILFAYQTKLPAYILKILWVNLQPLILFFCVEIASQLTLKNRSDISIRQSIYTNLIIIFSFFQPTITKVLSQSFSCRTIGLKKYMLIDLQQECLTDDHLKYIFALLVPLTFFWVLLIPIFLFWRLNHYKNQQTSLKILYRYSYLYIEYRKEKFYWDILKMFMRTLTIIIINIFNFNQLFKGLIFLGLNFVYIFFQSRNKPYRQEELNTLDKASCYLVIQTLYLIFISELSENYILKTIMSLIILGLNTLFLMKISKIVFSSKINPIEQNRTIKEKILFYLRRQFPKLFFWVELGQIHKTNVFRNWKRVRTVLSFIIKTNQITKQYQRFNVLRQMRQKKQQELQKSQKSESLIPLKQIELQKQSKSDVQLVQQQLLLSTTDMLHPQSITSVKNNQNQLFDEQQLFQINQQVFTNAQSPRNDKIDDSSIKFKSRSQISSSVFLPHQSFTDDNVKSVKRKSMFFKQI